MIAVVGVGLALLGLVILRGLERRPRPALPSLPERDVAVERVGLALARGLELGRRARSHREQRIVLAGELDGRACELRVTAEGFAIRVAISPRLPDGIHLRRLGQPTPDGRPYAVDLGNVRGRVPPGLVPALVSSCEARVSSLSLAGGRLELARSVDVHEFGGRPERVVELVKHALRCAERLESEFRRAC